MHRKRIDWSNPFLISILLSLPLIAFILPFVTILHNDIINHQTLTIQPEFINGILSAYGIIIGFWAAIIGLSYREHKMVLYARDFVQLIFFISLSLLMLCVFLFALEGIGAVPSYLVLFLSVIGVYLTCLFLGMTLHYIVFNAKFEESKKL